MVSWKLFKAVMGAFKHIWGIMWALRDYVSLKGYLIFFNDFNRALKRIKAFKNIFNILKWFKQSFKAH